MILVKKNQLHPTCKRLPDWPGLKSACRMKKGTFLYIKKKMAGNFIGGKILSLFTSTFPSLNEILPPVKRDLRGLYMGFYRDTTYENVFIVNMVQMRKACPKCIKDNMRVVQSPQRQQLQHCQQQTIVRQVQATLEHVRHAPTLLDSLVKRLIE